jgi:hypothetical protein
LPGAGAIWQAILNAADQLPPTYFLFISLFDRLFGPPEIAARLPSALAVAAGLFIVFDCARRSTDNLHGLAALALLTCSLLPYYGYEARPYGLYFMLASLELWLWVRTSPHARWPAVFFGLTFFLAFSIHYYTAVCVVPYLLFEITTWRPWQRPSAKLLAACAGILCGILVFSGPILAARTLSRGFWSPPSRRVLLAAFGDFFPYLLVIGSLAAIWIAATAASDRSPIDPMSAAERVGWYFVAIPLAGFAIAVLVTNAFVSRYFIGLLPGVSLAIACALWRHFRHRPAISSGIIGVLFLVGLVQQASILRNPSKIEPPTNPGSTSRVRSLLLVWEDLVRQEGKTTLAMRGDRTLGVDTRYYSPHPERYVLVTAPTPGVLDRLHQNFARYYPLTIWTMDELRAAARKTALVDPSDEVVDALVRSGLRVIYRTRNDINIVYLE